MSGPPAGKSRPRVLFVSRCLDQGGAERFVSTALCRLDPARFDLRLCLFRRILGYPLPDAVPVRVLMRPLEHRHWHLAPLVWRLARTLDEVEPEVVVSAYAYPSFVVGAALRLARRRPRWLARVAIHPQRGETGLRRALLALAYRRADSFVANSAGLAELYPRVYPRARGRIAHLPNATDFERIDALAREPLAEPAAPRTRPLLVAAGRLSREKRVDLMIEAVDRVRRQRDLELVVCGDGPLRGALARQAAERGLAGHVRFLGHCPNPFQWMARADLFLLASDHEGSPNALIEAQGLGVPAVASDCEFGPSEIVEPGRTGWLVPTGDAGALADAIAGALSERQALAEMGRAARLRARERFGAAPIVAALAAHLERLADPAEPRAAPLARRTA